jgi:uncharacterized protein YkwD
MPGGRPADTAHVVRLRFIAITALALACAASGAAASTALGARHHAHHSRRCAHTSSFRTGHLRARHRAQGCHGRHRRHLHRHTQLHRGSRGTAAGQCPDASLTPATWNVDRVRAAVLCLINRERAAAGESSLAPNAQLQQAAQGHTESMAFGGYVAHVGPRGDSPADRMRVSGYLSAGRSYEVGENIAWGTLWLATPRAIVEAWMASSEHRANILDAHFRDTAVGVSPHAPAALAHGQAGAIYTQDFGVIGG